ncbi:MAG: 16S rRNA (adenine(1518)-N(6)/adenine(1519)-N(6))-dimethyltransferase RsmA [Pseudomonadota bacterium]|nr:16S rRNA (adenine(1518)-N(6)/adenine(1519)-N(6))-dimethyltransferase RsmA [Pseudomonadota bacterium]
MSALTDLPPLREVIRSHGLDARKGLGQHFLLDLNLTAKIARMAGDLTGCDVLEVGPGPGGLTRALLLAGARRVVAIEKDSRCLDALAEVAAASDGRLEVIGADALQADIRDMVRPGARVVANLPYNVATPLLFGWLDRLDHIAGMTLMFQREVAERIVAAPGTRAYGRLAVMTGWRCRADIVMDLPARAFTPPPNVDSSVVNIIPRPAPLGDADPGMLSRVVAAAFNQRRKMLRQCLKPLGLPPEDMLGIAGIDPTRRGETLSIEEFCALARAYSDAAR